MDDKYSIWLALGRDRARHGERAAYNGRPSPFGSVPDVTSLARLIVTAAGLAVQLVTLPAAAQTAPPLPPAAQQGAPLSFDQFKAQQLQQLQRVQALLAQRLGAPDLAPDRRQRLQHQQAQLGKFAALPPDQQDQILHRRFDRMDANHDGVVDPGELQAFRQAQRERAQMKRDAAAPGSQSDDFWPTPN